MVVVTWPGKLPDFPALTEAGLPLPALLVTVETPRDQADLHRFLGRLGYVPERISGDEFFELWRFVHPDGEQP